MIVHETFQAPSLYLKLSQHRIYISNVWKIVAVSAFRDWLPLSETLWLNSLLTWMNEREYLIVCHSCSGNEVIISNSLEPSMQNGNETPKDGRTWVCHEKLGHGACPVKTSWSWPLCVTRSARKFHLIVRHRADKTYGLLALSYMIRKLLQQTWC